MKATATNRRVFIIGLDGGTWGILNPLIEEQVMPNLKSLIERGIQSSLTSTIPPVTAPAWTTFQTGVNPGKHGIYEFNNYKPGTYRTWITNSQAIPLKTIWQIAGDQGRKVIIVNVPITYPPYPVNGCLVSGMLTPGTRSAFTYPEELSKEILAKVPGYKILTTQDVFNVRGLKIFLSELMKTEKKRTQVMKHLLQHHPWDLAMVHYQSTDVLQHAVYAYLDPQSPYYDKSKYQQIKRFYRIIDDGIGELMEIVPESALRIVMSDHGFCPVRKLIHLNFFLAESEWLQYHQRSPGHRLLRSALATLSKFDRFNVNRFILRGRRRRIRESLSEGLLIDWRNTQAFMINGWVYGNIYLNLKNREKEGIVLSHRYDGLCQEIGQALYDLENPEKEKMVEQVYQREDIYQGPYLESAPDLIVKPKIGYEFSSTLFQRKELLRPAKSRRDHLGSHSPEGILVMQGEMIDTSAASVVKNTNPNIVDLFPTILFALGVGVPSYIDGKILEGAFKPEYFSAHPPVIKDTGKTKLVRDKPAYTNQEHEQINKRLRDLGYL